MSDRDDELSKLLKADLLAGLVELKDDASMYQLARADGIDDLVPGLRAEELEYESEGDGNPCYSVVKFELDGQLLGLVRFSGTYSSWDSTEWDDDMTVVVPRQVITTEYLAADGSEDKLYTFL